MLGYLGMMLMGIVDTILVGSLGPVALGAVGVGSSVVAVAFLFGLGLHLGIDRQVAVAHGAGRPDDVARAHAHGIEALLNLLSKFAQQRAERIAFPFTHHYQRIACFGQEIHHHRTGCFRNGRGSVIRNNARQCQ